MRYGQLQCFKPLENLLFYQILLICKTAVEKLTLSVAVYLDSYKNDARYNIE